MYRLQYHKKHQNLIGWDSRDNHNLSQFENFKNFANFIWLQLGIYSVLEHRLLFNIFIAKNSDIDDGNPYMDILVYNNILSYMIDSVAYWQSTRQSSRRPGFESCYNFFHFLYYSLDFRLYYGKKLQNFDFFWTHFHEEYYFIFWCNIQPNFLLYYSI